MLTQWTSLVVQWFRLHAPLQGHGFDPWLGELRFHVPHHAAKILKDGYTRWVRKVSQGSEGNESQVTLSEKRFINKEVGLEWTLNVWGRIGSIGVLFTSLDKIQGSIYLCMFSQIYTYKWLIEKQMWYTHTSTDMQTCVCLLVCEHFCHLLPCSPHWESLEVVDMLVAVSTRVPRISFKCHPLQKRKPGLLKASLIPRSGQESTKWAILMCQKVRTTEAWSEGLKSQLEETPLAKSGCVSIKINNVK